MDTNGYNSFNNFNGPVFVDGDVDIDGNLEVTGTINGGGSGSVNNPMTVDLDANQFAFLNVSEIAGFAGVLRTTQLDLQDNEIININELKGNSNDNKLVVSANVEMSENLDMTDKSIININELKCSVGSEIKTSILNLQNNNILGANSVHLNLIEGIANSISMFGDVKIITSLNLQGNVISNVGSLTAYSPTANVNLDFIPATSGTANQVLSRDSKYNPNNPNTHKLVWADPGSGFITNPLSTDLNANFKNIMQVDTLVVKAITLMQSQLGLGLITCSDGLFQVPIIWLLAANGNGPFYRCFNTEFITPRDSKGLTIDSKDTSGVDSKITISTPILNINNSTNLTPTAIGITGNINFTNANAILSNSGGLIIDASQIKNNGSPIIISDVASFSQGIKTNTLNSVDGGSMSILQSLTMAVNKQLKSPLIFTDGLRSYTTDLIIAGLLPDNKTQKDILITAPIITLNNQFDPLIPESCQIKILGTIIFDNVLTDSIIRGSYITIDSKQTNNTATQLYLKGSEMAITSSVNDIKLIVPVNKFIDLQGNVIVGDGKTSQIQVDNLYPKTGTTVTTTNFKVSRKLQSYTANIVTTRNVRTTLFKNYGSNTLAATSLNTISPVLITTSNGPSTGSKAWDSLDIESGDKLCLTLTGILTTGTNGSMNIFVYVGVAGSLFQATTFTTPNNITINNEIVTIKIELDVIVGGGNFTINNVAFCSLNRYINSTINMIGTIGASIPLTGSPIFEIYASHTVLQASTFKLVTYSMEVY